MPGLVDGVTIAALKAAAESAMLDSFEVLRPGAAVSDGRGHMKPGAPTVTSTGPCNLRGITGNTAESEIAGRLALSRPAAIDMPVAADVKEADQVRVNTTRTFDVKLVSRAGVLAMTTQVVAEELG